jgi:Arc/MetJ family transcription regulator
MPDRKPHDPQPPEQVQKNVRVDEDLLRRAGEILGTMSSAETVAAALDLIVFRDEVCRGIRSMAGSNSMRDIYEAEG